MQIKCQIRGQQFGIVLLRSMVCERGRRLPASKAKELRDAARPDEKNRDATQLPAASLIPATFFFRDLRLRAPVCTRSQGEFFLSPLSAEGRRFGAKIDYQLL